MIQRAIGAWESRDSLSIAEGYRSLTGDVTLGSLAALSCERRGCIGAAFTKVIPDRSFDFDPTLDSARLRMRWAGEKHRVVWTGEGQTSLETGDPTAPAPGAERDAIGEGRIFGDLVTFEQTAAGLLEQGEAASSQDDPSGPGISIALSGSGESHPTVGPSTPPSRVSGSSIAATAIATNNDNCITYKRVEKRFARMINRERRQRGQNRLRLDTELGKAARKHTGEMATKTLLHHTSSEDLSKRVTNWRVLGENVGVGGGVVSLHDAFMASPPHRENVLYPTYRHVGVGVRKVAGTLWVTVIFETRKNPGTTLRCR